MGYTPVLYVQDVHTVSADIMSGTTFEWDEAKNQRNILNHRVSFACLKLIFDGFRLTRVDDRFEYGERRELTLGFYSDSSGSVVLAVAYTRREGGRIRLISARVASRKEWRIYHEAIA